MEADAAVRSWLQCVSCACAALVIHRWGIRSALVVHAARVQCGGVAVLALPPASESCVVETKRVRARSRRPSCLGDAVGHEGDAQRTAHTGRALPHKIIHTVHVRMYTCSPGSHVFDGHSSPEIQPAALHCSTSDHTMLLSTCDDLSAAFRRAYCTAAQRCIPSTAGFNVPPSPCFPTSFALAWPDSTRIGTNCQEIYRIRGVGR